MPNENDRGRHTPGPWSTAAGASGQVVAVFGSDGKYVSKVDAYPVRPLAENDANARLIAAAPELAEALAYYVRLHEKHRLAMPEGNENEGKEWARTLVLARAAIRKAEGGAQ